MTAINYPHPVEAVADAPHEAISKSQLAWRVWAMLTAGIGCIYLLMYNAYWVPGGDSELYVALARSWAKEQQYTFNGQFVSISPPGWPWLLAMAMKLQPTFAFLKLITLISMTLAMGFWYWFLLRFMSIWLAALLTALCAISGHVYPLSFWMHSDALFCMLATAAMVVACQINERKPYLIARIVLLAVLCVSAQLVRWAGVLQWLVIAGVLVKGYPIPINRQWISEFARQVVSAPWTSVFVSCAVTFGTFAIVRSELRLTPEQALQAKAAGATFDDVGEAPAESRDVPLLPGKQSEKETLGQEIWRRVRDSGKWFSWLLWPEMRFIGGVKLVRNLDALLGWLLIIPLVVCWVRRVRARQWMWLGVGMYCFGLCLNWPNPNPRYLVPILPLVVFAMLDGTRTVFEYLSMPRWGMHIVTALLVTFGIANSALLAVDISVARSDSFYDRYEGGLNTTLLSCLNYINNRHIKDGQLGVSEIYNNLGRRRESKFGLRATVMLSDRVVRSVPGKFGGDVHKARFIRWARDEKIRWYLYQKPISPWRVWHFRLPAWLQKALSREEVGRPSGGWVLFRYIPPVNVVVPFPIQTVITIQPAKFVEQEVEPVQNWPTRVPGM